MELLQSKRFKLPILYFISDRREIRDLPIGIPFIYAHEKDKEHIIRLLEYEVIYQKALATKLPFNFRLLLEEAGFTDLKTFHWEDTPFMSYTTDGDLDVDYVQDNNLTGTPMFKEFVKDAVAYVDIQKIKELKLFPVWFADIEKAVDTNIQNYAIFNSYMYNKKLEGMYGGIEISSPSKNLLNIDISASIPKSIGTSIMLLSRWMAETFFCDIIITGRKTIFIPYEEIHNMDIEALYDEYGNAQECAEYRKIITSSNKHYKHCFIFGDNHSVCGNWNAPVINSDRGTKLNKWKIDKLICFHTTSNDTIPGFADWFTPKEVEHIKDWVKYLSK